MKVDFASWDLVCISRYEGIVVRDSLREGSERDLVECRQIDTSCLESEGRCKERKAVGDCVRKRLPTLSAL